MIPTKQCTRKQRKSSATRNDNRPWGYQPQMWNSKSRARTKKAVEAGILDKSALSVTMTLKTRKRR